MILLNFSGGEVRIKVRERFANFVRELGIFRSRTASSYVSGLRAFKFANFSYDN